MKMSSSSRGIMMTRSIVVLALLLNSALSYHQQYRRWQRISTSITPQAVTTSSTSTSTSMPVVQTVLSVMDVVRKEGFRDWDTKKHNSNVNTLLALAVDDKKLTLRILQKTNGPVPRSYLPTLMILDVVDKSVIDPVAVFALIEEGMKWYLDCGGRASRLEVSVPPALVDVVQSMGFTQGQSQKESLQLRQLVSYPTDYVVMTCDAPRLRTHCEERGEGKKGISNPHVIYDIVGRLAHDMGDPKASIKPYTSSLQAQPQSAAVFRNMGSAYHAAGDMQLAFASYQQAVQLDEADALVYLKLAFFYEDFASKDWIDAAEHSQKCYEYYLDKVDPGDTAILTRLGNLLVREHKPDQAVSVFTRALDLDPGLENVWFNQAHAQMTIGDFPGASISLRKTLEIDPSIIAARHMLKALSEEEATSASASEEDYVKDLFDTYAQVYDTHVKKLLYSATRVIRQELATIYRSKHGLYDNQQAPSFSLTPLERAEIMKKEGEEEQRRKDLEMIELTKQASEQASQQASKDGTKRDTKEGYKAMSEVDQFKEALAPVGSSCSTYSSFMNSSLDILDIGCGTGLAGTMTNSDPNPNPNTNVNPTIRANHNTLLYLYSNLS